MNEQGPLNLRGMWQCLNWKRESSIPYQEGSGHSRKN